MVNRTFLCVRRGSVFLLACVLAVPGRAETPLLCVQNACLGMTLAQAQNLDLQPANMFALAFRKGMLADESFGLDAKGERVWFVGSSFDKKTIAEFAQRVNTICAVDFISASLKASDGKKIDLTFRPVMRNGRGELVLAQIHRALPSNLSESQKAELVKQAAERYGASFSRDMQISPKRPTAAIPWGGGTLNLTLPHQNVGKALREQPGCSDKARLD